MWIRHQAKYPVCGIQEFARDSNGQLRGSQDHSFWNSLSTLGNDLFSSPNPSPAGEDQPAGETFNALCICPAQPHCMLLCCRSCKDSHLIMPYLDCWIWHALLVMSGQGSREAMYCL